MSQKEFRNMVNMAAQLMRCAALYERKTIDLNEVGAQSLGKACWHLEQAALMLVQAAANTKTD